GGFFRGGEARVEVVETYTSGDLAVLVVIERQHGTVGDLPEQDWSLRVTWVFRRTAESDWELVHRHADALVHAIDHERLGGLARGESPRLARGARSSSASVRRRRSADTRVPAAGLSSRRLRSLPR